MSWFNEVTGTNDFERQSWRDSYNAGRAAGDFTGNVNARLDAERQAYGATVSGSSTRFSALELAERNAGVGSPSFSVGATPAASSGSGNAVVVQGPSAPGRAAGGFGPGSGSFLEIPSADPTVLIPDDRPLKRIGIGGPQESLGAISDIGWVRTQTGWTSVPSSDVKERIEDDWFQESYWMLRNKIAPDLMVTPQPFPEFIQNKPGPFLSGPFNFNWATDEWQLKPGYVAIGGGF